MELIYITIAQLLSSLEALNNYLPKQTKPVTLKERILKAIEEGKGFYVTVTSFIKKVDTTYLHIIIDGIEYRVIDSNTFYLITY